MVGRHRRLKPGLAALLLVGSCGETGPRSPPPVEPPGSAPSNLRATLADDTISIGGRRGWTTYWRLCWDAVPGAAGYQVQTVTSEGTSSRLRQTRDHCFRLQVAAGLSRGVRREQERRQQLVWQAANLGFRVRAWGEDHRVGPWSAILAAGDSTGSGR